MKSQLADLKLAFKVVLQEWIVAVFGPVISFSNVRVWISNSSMFTLAN